MNRKTITGISALVAVVVLFLGLTWLEGALVRSRLARLDHEMSGTLPLFTIAQRQVSAGLFSSTVQVTYQLNTRLFQGMAAAAARAKKTALRTSLPADSLPSFTLRHRIQHGPLPGFMRFGMARIDSEFVMSEATRQQLLHSIGTDEPLKIVTLLGITGGGTTTLDSPAFTYDDPNNHDHMEWGGVQGHLDFSRGMARQQGEINFPGMHLKGSSGEDMVFGSMRLAYDLQRAFELLYLGKVSFTVARLAITPAAPTEIVEMQDLSYAVNTTASGDYVDTIAQFDVGDLHAKTFTASAVHYDFSLRHMHGPTYAVLTARLRKLYLAAAGGDNNAGQRVFDPIKEYGATLLEHQPEFVIDRVSLTMPEGSARISGRLSLPGFVHADLEAPPLALVGKIEATLDISFDEGLLNRDWGSSTAAPAATEQRAPPRRGPAAGHVAPPPSTAGKMREQLTALEQQGYLTREGDHLKSHLEMHHGVMTANGKRVGPPGNGAGGGAPGP